MITAPLSPYESGRFTRYRFLKGGAGFTLIEIIVVMGLLAFVGMLSAGANIDSYRGSLFRSERNTLVMILQKARSQSVNNVCLGSGCTDGKPHGIVLEAGRYVIFQGSSFATRDSAQDEEIKANSSISRSGFSEVVFSQLSGQANVSGTIELSDGQRSAAIAINNEGRISW